MYSINVDEKKNRIYIKLDAIDTGDGEKLVRQLMAETARLTPGFTGVSDISNFSLNDPAEAVWADKALKTLAEAGMVSAVRVTGREVVYKETKEKYGYMVGLAKTVEDADRILDTP